MGEVRKDPHGIEYFEVKRGLFVAGDDYGDAIRQHERYGFGWSIGRLDGLGCGPLVLDRYESRPKKGKS